MAGAKTINILGKKIKLRILTAERFKRPFTVANPVPWDKSVYSISQIKNYLTGREEGRHLVEVWRRFASITSSLKGQYHLKEFLQEVGARAHNEIKVGRSPKPKKISLLQYINQ